MSAELPGDIILRELRENIRRFNLNESQLHFTELFTRAHLPCIYGNDFFANEARIKQENGNNDIYPMILVSAPRRRIGKTYGTAVWAACLLLCVPDTKIVLYSPGRRQSGYIMELINDHLKFLKQFTDWQPANQNDEVFSIRVGGNERIVQCLPASESITRGSGGTCVICEEAAAMPGPFFVRVVLPVTAPAKTSCICISSRQDDNGGDGANWFSALLDGTFFSGGSPFHTFNFPSA